MNKTIEPTADEKQLLADLSRLLAWASVASITLSKKQHKAFERLCVKVRECPEHSAYRLIDPQAQTYSGLRIIREGDKRAMLRRNNTIDFLEERI